MRRILALALGVTFAFGALCIDVGESWRQGAITDGSAHAKRHKHHKRRHRRHHKHRRAPASEM
jgi:hypothetical protein